MPSNARLKRRSRNSTDYVFFYRDSFVRGFKDYRNGIWTDVVGTVSQQRAYENGRIAAINMPEIANPLIGRGFKKEFIWKMKQITSAGVFNLKPLAQEATE